MIKRFSAGFYWQLLEGEGKRNMRRCMEYYTVFLLLLPLVSEFEKIEKSNKIYIFLSITET